MKNLFISLLVFLACFHVSVHSQTDFDPLLAFKAAEYELKGPVKSSRYKIFESAFSEDGKLIKGEEKRKQRRKTPDFVSFNSKGFIDSLVSFQGLTDRINFYILFSFNNEEYPVRKEQYYRDGDLKYYETMTYSERLLLQRIEYHRIGKVQNKTEYTYNDAGKLIFEVKTDFYHEENDAGHVDDVKEDIVDTSETFIYNDKNQLVTRAPDTDYERSYLYDDNGKLKSTFIKNPYGNVAKNYFEDSTIIIAYNTGGKDSIVQYLDHRGNVVKEGTYRNGQLKSVELREYTYDDHGNWILMICQDIKDVNAPNRRETWFEERVITYY